MEIRATWFKFASNIVVNNERIIQSGVRKFESLVINRVEGSPMRLDASAFLAVLSQYLQSKDISLILSKTRKYFSMETKNISDAEIENAVGKFKDAVDAKPFEQWEESEKSKFNAELENIVPFGKQDKQELVADYVVFRDSEAYSASGEVITQGKRVLISKSGLSNEVLTEEMSDYTLAGVPRHTNVGILGTHNLITAHQNPIRQKARFSGVLGKQAYNTESQDIEIDVVGYSTATLRDMGNDYSKAMSSKPSPEPLYVKMLGILVRIMDASTLTQKLKQLQEAYDELLENNDGKLSDFLNVEEIKKRSFKLGWPLVAVILGSIIGLGIFSWLVLR